MTIFQAVVLGIVQGLTEFLPISSSGHLVMFEQFFNLENELFLTIALHFGTLFAVFFVYYKDVWHVIRHPTSTLSKRLIIATIPTVIIVWLFKSFAPSIFASCFYIVGFAISAFLLVVTSLVYRKNKNGIIGVKSSIIIGIAQGLACLPGISRSGSTICAGLLCGEDKKSVADFSFLLSIPIIIASIAYEFIFDFSNITVPIIPLLVGMFCACIFGIFAIKFMLKIVQKAKLYYFSIYLFILAFLLVFINFIR